MELNYKLYGQGDPVIILHGLFGSLDNWVSFGKKMGDHHMTYLVDQRDHGKSEHTDAFNYDLLSEDLYGFMEDNWIHTSHIIGHSMGGKTAMRFSLEHGDMLEKLIVLDMAPRQYGHRHQSVFDAMKAVPLDKIKLRQEAQSILMDALDGDYATAGFLLKNIRREKDGSFRWKMNIKLLEHEYDNIVAPMPTDSQFDGEVLFVKGENSAYIVEEDEPLIYSLFPNAQIQTLKDAGHWVHADQPVALLKMIQAFFKEE